MLPDGPYRLDKAEQGIKDWWGGKKAVRLRRFVRWCRRAIPRFVWFAVRVAVALGLLYIAREVKDDGMDPDEAIAAAGLVLGALIAISLSPRFGQGLLERLAKLSLGPVAVELVADAQEAAGHTAAEEGGGSGEPVSLQRLRLRFERKLSYIANDQLGNGKTPQFVTIGSLRYDGYISEAEEKTLARLMVLRTADLETLPSGEKDAFVKAATKVVNNIRASVLHGHVRILVKKELKEEGWTLTEVVRDRRNDLLVQRGTTSALLAPVFATSEDAEFLKPTKERLGKRQARHATRRVMVVPRTSDLDPDPKGDPAIVKTSGLIKLLKDLLGDGASPDTESSKEPAAKRKARSTK